MYGDISSTESTIDGQTVYDRVEELRAADGFEDTEECPWLEEEDHDPEYCDTCDPEPVRLLDEDEVEELESLEALLTDLEYVGGDARHVTMIRDDHFAEWVKDGYLECQGAPPDEWRPYIDWDAWTDDQRSDYTEIDWDGTSWLCYGG